jgi:3D (Asp-Asp-Asp) domain-containing protein
MTKKTLVFHSIIAGLVVSVLLGLLAPLMVSAQPIDASAVLEKIEKLTKCGIDKDSYGVKKTVTMLVTAYSSTPDQTDDTPFITASGKHVRKGIVANNGLKFGTKVRIPELGPEIYVVEDRMHPRKGKLMLDRWVESREEAKEFGVKLLEIEILEG